MSRRSGTRPANPLPPPQRISLPLAVRGKRQRVSGLLIADDLHARPDGLLENRSARTASQPSRNCAQVIVPAALLELPPQASGVEDAHMSAVRACEPEVEVVCRDVPKVGHSMG